MIWICSWLKSPHHSGFRLPFNSAFRVSSSTERAVQSIIRIIPMGRWFKIFYPNNLLITLSKEGGAFEFSIPFALFRTKSKGAHSVGVYYTISINSNWTCRSRLYQDFKNFRQKSSKIFTFYLDIHNLYTWVLFTAQLTQFLWFPNVFGHRLWSFHCKQTREQNTWVGPDRLIVEFLTEPTVYHRK